MSPKKQSWKKVIQERQRESFVGRAEYLKQFSDNLASDIPNYLLFFVIGEGGVGKSNLLKQFEAIGKSPKTDAIVITCDDEYSSPVSAMGYIAEQLAKFDIISKDFNERYKTYRTRRDEIESDPKAPRGALNLVVRGMTDFAIKTVRRAPGVGVFAEYVDEKEAGDALAQGVNYLVDRIGNKDEVLLLREPERTLTPLFIDLLSKASEKHRLVLMFDVFERTREALEPWLLEFLDFKFGEFDTGLTFVISGRDTVDQHWTKIASSICYITLEPFSFEETLSYLRLRKITNKSLVTQIFEDTGGLPVLIELLAGTNPKPGSPLPDISRDAVKRFLQWIPEDERRNVAILAAIPRYFNLDILSAALGHNAHNDFNWLSVQSYIRTSAAHGWFYHEKVRELMLRYLRNTNPSVLTSVHDRLAVFFEAQQQKMGFNNKVAYASEVWCDYEIEKVYHLLCEHPRDNIKYAVNSFLHAFRWRWGFAESVAQVCQQVNSEISSNEMKETSRLMARFYQDFNKDHYKEFISHANILLDRNDLDRAAESTLLAHRGYAYSRIDNHEKALIDLNRAIELDENDSWAIANRGITYREMGDYKQAIIDFNRAVSLDRDYGWAIANRGLTYQEMEKYDLAIADFDKAVFVDKNDEWAIANRGLTYREMGMHERAIADFNKAISLNEKDSWNIANRGLTYREMKMYEQAISDLNKAISMNDEETWILVERGNTYFEMEKYQEALADFDAAISLDNNNIWALERRGITYWKLEEYGKATTDFDKIISSSNNQPSSFIVRGDLYWEIDDLEKALADYNQAILLDSKNHAAHEKKSIVLRSLRQYQDALDALSYTDDDIPCSNCIAHRGELYRRLGDTEKALVNFDAAIKNREEIHSYEYSRRAAIYNFKKDFKSRDADIRYVMDLTDRNTATLYNKAIVCAIVNNFDDAINWLTQAVKSDKEAKVYAKYDDLFDSLRNRSDFQSLLKQ